MSNYYIDCDVDEIRGTGQGENMTDSTVSVENVDHERNDDCQGAEGSCEEGYCEDGW